MNNNIFETFGFIVCFRRNFFFYFIFYHLIFIYDNRGFPNRPLNPFFRAFLSTGNYVILYFWNRHARFKIILLVKLHLQASTYHIEPPASSTQTEKVYIFIIKRERIQQTKPVDPETSFELCIKMVTLAYQSFLKDNLMCRTVDDANICVVSY